MIPTTGWLTGCRPVPSSTDLNKRKELVQKANKITSDKVAAAFTHHPTSILVYRKEVTYPDASRIPGLVDLDRATLKKE